MSLPPVFPIEITIDTITLIILPFEVFLTTTLPLVLGYHVYLWIFCSMIKLMPIDWIMLKDWTNFSVPVCFCLPYLEFPVVHVWQDSIVANMFSAGNKTCSLSLILLLLIFPVLRKFNSISLSLLHFRSLLRFNWLWLQNNWLWLQNYLLNDSPCALLLM